MCRTYGLCALVLPLLVACAHGQSAEDRQLAQMRDELSQVQHDSDRFDQRLSSLEVQAADETHRPARPTDTSPTPRLRVVRLSPDGSEISQSSSETAGASTEDDSPRPVIRVRGTRGRKADVIEETLPDETANIGHTPHSGRPSALDPAAKRAYDAALALVNSKHYTEALDAFAAFLIRYPDHPYAANATYWRGECYYAQGDYVRAKEQFEGVIARFPLGNKTPDALLKLGLCQQKLGNPARARTYFDKLLQQYPKSDAARRIPRDASDRSGAAGPGVKESP